jgi:hypothetical protein
LLDPQAASPAMNATHNPIDDASLRARLSLVVTMTF